MDRDRVLKCFPPKPPSEPNNKPEPTWHEADCLLHQAIDTLLSEAKKLSTLLHHLANKNELLTDENEGLRDVLSTKKKHNKKGKVLDLQQRKEYHGGAIFWSPRKKREAEARDATNR
jgi:regulator of replication initiation timing